MGERNCTRVFGRRNGAPDFSQKAGVPEFPRASKLARRVLQLLATKTLVMTVSQGCSCLKATSLLQNFNGFADSVVLGLVCKLSLQGSHFCPSSTRCQSSRFTFWKVSPAGIQNGFYRHIHSVIKMIGREEGQNETRRNT